MHFEQLNSLHNVFKLHLQQSTRTRKQKNKNCIDGNQSISDGLLLCLFLVQQHEQQFNFVQPWGGICAQLCLFSKMFKFHSDHKI